MIAPSFGEIFHDNSYQNGLLPIVLDEPAVRRIAAAIESAAVPEIIIDLTRCRIVLPDGAELPFAIPDERRAALLVGMDELDVLLGRMPDLEAFQRADRVARPWVWPDAT